MAVVDSAALIPLAWVGRLDLVSTVFEGIRTTEAVRSEVLTEGKRGTAALDEFLVDVTVHAIPDRAEDVASMEGVAVVDASAILLADDDEELLLANDRGLIGVARSHGVECWWVTTLLLRCAKTGELTADEATDLLYDLVDRGMNLHPEVYTRVQKQLRELGE
jgi:predicted nucleic acid-binding protein